MSSSVSTRYATFLHQGNSSNLRVRCCCMAQWSAEFSDQVETIQKRALRIIFGGSSFTNQSYESFCHNLELSPLSTRRDQLASDFFTNSYIQPAVFITLSLSRPTILKRQS